MTATIVRGGPETIDENALFLRSGAAPVFEPTAANGRKDHGSFRSAPGRRSARGQPRGGACCERPDRSARGGAAGDRTAADGALADSAPEGEAAPDGAAETREASGSGRPADHRACPAVLPDRRHAGPR